MSFRSFLGKEDEKKPVKAGGFKSFLKTKEPKLVSKSPFNPNTPGHKEFITQLEQKSGSTSIRKNFLNSLGGAAKQVGKLVTDIPVDFVKGGYNTYANPSGTQLQTEKQLGFTGNHPVALTGKALSRTYSMYNVPRFLDQ